MSLGGIIVAILLATGGSDSSGPTVATSPPAVTTVPPVTTQAAVTVTETKRVTTPAKTTTTSRQTPAVAATPARRSSGNDVAAVRDVIRSHWAAKEAGNYEQAYTMFAPGFQRHDAWIQSMVSDNLTSASISVGRVSFDSSTTATATVDSLRTYANDGCHTWTGSYAMTRLGGRWLIADSNLNRMSC